jgi:hypothetical protein
VYLKVCGEWDRGASVPVTLLLFTRILHNADLAVNAVIIPLLPAMHLVTLQREIYLARTGISMMPTATASAELFQKKNNQRKKQFPGKGSAAIIMKIVFIMQLTDCHRATKATRFLLFVSFTAIPIGIRETERATQI